MGGVVVTGDGVTGAGLGVTTIGLGAGAGVAAAGGGVTTTGACCARLVEGSATDANNAAAAMRSVSGFCLITEGQRNSRPDGLGSPHDLRPSVRGERWSDCPVSFSKPSQGHRPAGGARGSPLSAGR
jgi:hypothetical protein